MPTVTVRDETAAGEERRAFRLDLAERVTVRELIRSRVFQEVKDHNARQAQVFHGLVRPADAEETLNGYRLDRPRSIDWEEQYDRAIDAFERNGFLLLVDDRQRTDLEDQVLLGPRTEVTFVSLMPLVGG